MKLKRFFKSKKVEAFKSSIQADLQPVVIAVNKPWKWFKTLVNKKPRHSLFWMFLIVVTNICLLFYFNKFQTSGFSYSSIHAPFSNAIDSLGSNMGVAFSWENYRKMTAIQDTLNLLMSKPQKSSEDSLVFIRLCDQIAKVDPVFFNKVQSVTKGQRDTSRINIK